MGKGRPNKSKEAAIRDDVEVVLMRLERARDAIREICPILLSQVKRKEPRFPETGKIYSNFMESSKRGITADEVHERSTETDPELLIPKVIELLDKISSLIRASKAEIVLTCLGDQAIRTRSPHLPLPKDVDAKDDLSPEQDFYYRLAKSDLV